MSLVWIGSKVKGIDLERLGCSKLSSQRTYTTYHLLFSLAGNPVRRDLRMVGAACGLISKLIQLYSMISTSKMVSPMRIAATWKSSTSRCRSSSGRSELISLVMNCLSAARLDRQCRSVKCTMCKIRETMTDLTQFDASGLFKYTNWQVSTTRNEPSSGNYLRIDLTETIDYVSTLKTMLRGNTLIKWIQAKSASFLACVDERRSVCPLAGGAGLPAGLTFEVLDETVG